MILAGILFADLKKLGSGFDYLLGIVCFIPLSLTGSCNGDTGAAIALAFEAALTLRAYAQGQDA
ncbi:MAG: hypothetical protein R2912_09585 [Eubacteriales bacterium]